MRRPTIAFLALLALAAVVALGVAQTRTFPGPPTDTNPRANTPNDPDFDRSEPDDEDGDFFAGSSVFDEDNRLFGFAPESTRDTAKYLDPGHPPFDPANPRSLGQPQISRV